MTGATDGAPGTRIVRATAALARVGTDSPVNIDLSVPIWTIEHVAFAFHLSVDAAREYTKAWGEQRGGSEGFRPARG